VSDHLGSTTVSYDPATDEVSRQYYNPWGELRGASEPVLDTDIGYTGQRLDTSADLMYYNARYYDPTIGRFISADTIIPDPGDPQSISRYSYVSNNPVRYSDPTGHCSFGGQQIYAGPCRQEGNEIWDYG
jgi:RHS repeat-associated protein